jgi:hypothetical protein
MLIVCLFVALSGAADKMDPREEQSARRGEERRVERGREKERRGAERSGARRAKWSVRRRRGEENGAECEEEVRRGEESGVGAQGKEERRGESGVGWGVRR